MSSAAQIRERMLARSKQKRVVAPFVFGVTVPVPTKVALVAEVIAEFVIIESPEVLSFSRATKELEERERRRSGHKRRNAYRFWFWKRSGSGAHDPKYKNVRRGGIRHRKHVRV